MKALKYGLTLVLGLSMGWGAQAFAQASGQTQEVVPNNPNTLPEVPVVAPQDMIQDSMPELLAPEKGIAPPKIVEDLLSSHEYDKAVEEFEKFSKTAKGDLCHIIYARMMFYERLMVEDMDRDTIYKVKRDQHLADLEKNCPQFADLYVAKARMASDNVQQVVMWMDKAIALGATYSYCYMMRADALWTLGQTEKACADYKKAAELKDPVAISLSASRCSAQ